MWTGAGGLGETTNLGVQPQTSPTGMSQGSAAMVLLPSLENFHMREPWLDGPAQESCLNSPNGPPCVEPTPFQYMRAPKVGTVHRVP